MVAMIVVVVVLAMVRIIIMTDVIVVVFMKFTPCLLELVAGSVSYRNGALHIEVATEPIVVPNWR